MTRSSSRRTGSGKFFSGVPWNSQRAKLEKEREEVQSQREDRCLCLFIEETQEKESLERGREKRV